MTDQPQRPLDQTADHPTDRPLDPAYDAADPAPAQSRWRGLASSRRAMAAGAVAAGLALGGAGFGVGYAVGDDTAPVDVAQQTQPGEGDLDDRGFRGGPGGDMGGQMGVPPGGPGSDLDGTTGQAPDFDGDGQPDTESSTQQS